MATLLLMRSRVRSVVQDSGGSFITDIDIDGWINEALLDVNSRLKLVPGEGTGVMGDAGTSVANGTIDLPSDFIETISLRIGADDDVEFVDDDMFWQEADAGSSPSRTLGRVFNEKYELYPHPASGDAFRLRYVKKPSALTDDGNIPSIPEELHGKLIAYARAHAKYKEGDFGSGDRYMAMFEDGLPPMTPKARIAPGPFRVGIESGYFDTADYLT